MKRIILSLMLGISSPNYAQISLNIGAETGTVDSGLPIPLVESYSKNGNSTVDDSNGDPYTANSLHYIQAQSAANWAREGDFVLKFYGDGSNYPNNDYAHRAELSNNLSGTALDPGEEWYYSLSFYPPSSVWDINSDSHSTVISQWKQYGGGNPNGEIRLSNEGDYKIYARSVRYNWEETGEDPYIHIGTAVPDTWNDFKFQIKHSTGSDGFIKVWLNGELIFENNGPTLYSSSAGGYMKFGMYTQITDERTIYYDAIRMSNFLSVPVEVWSQDQVHIPSISLTSPSNSLNPVSGENVVLKADANDPAGKKIGTPGGITQVEYFANGNSIGVVTSAPYNMTWNSPADGTYAISAVVTDADGNQASSEVVSIRVGYYPPEVNITNPKHLDNLTSGTNTTINADASDADGSIVKVDFYLNNTLVNTDTSVPYTYDWTPSVAGAYIVKAIATDSNGKSNFDKISVTVDANIQTSSVNSIHDATIREGNPSSTGNWSRVDIYGRPQGENLTVGLFKFDIRSYASAAEIRDAKLRLYPDVVQNTGAELTIFSASGDDWDEANVTWNHSDRPQRVGSPLTSINVSTNGIYYEFDVTSFIVEKHASGDSFVTFWVQDIIGVKNQIEIDSHTRPNPPLLEITTGDIANLPLDTTNSAPVSEDISAFTNESTEVNIILSGSDTDDDILVYSIVNQPSNGTVSLNGKMAIYTPNTSFTGEDSFTYITNDGIENSNTATVSITVNPLNGFTLTVLHNNDDESAGLLGDTSFVDIYVEGLNTTLLGLEAEIHYDPTELSVTPLVNSSYAFNDFLVQTNEVSPGHWVISAADAEGLNEDASLFALKVSGLSLGKFDITISNININEEAHPDVTIPFLVASRLCGDVTNDETISALDATYILRNSVYLAPQFPLVNDDSLAADVTANGDITAYDASQILQYEVGLLDEFACGYAFKKAEPVLAMVDWSLVDTFEGNSTIEVEFSAPTKGIYSTEMTIDLPEGVSFIGLDDVPEGLQQMIHQRDNQVHISLFGVEGLDSGEFLVQVTTESQTNGGAKIVADFRVNENPSTELNEIGLISLPTTLLLSQNYPNPFNPTTQIAYQLPDAANVRLSVYNLLGQEVEVLVNERKEAGSYTASWNASYLSSGVYMYRLEVGSNVIAKRMTLIK